jgi:hypothetical protein
LDWQGKKIIWEMVGKIEVYPVTPQRGWEIVSKYGGIKEWREAVKEGIETQIREVLFSKSKYEKPPHELEIEVDLPEEGVTGKVELKNPRIILRST